MLNLRVIHKPTTIQEAVQLLQRPGTFALAGGTGLNASARRDVEAVVDLSALRLDYIREDKGTLALGATTTLAAVVESPMLRALGNGILAQAAHRTVASILRNQASVAGTLISEPDGLFAAALLALDARVTIVRQDHRTVAVDDFLSMRDHLLNMALLTEISIPLANPHALSQTVARTPADKPIVGVVATVQMQDGVAHAVRIALCGVGETARRAKSAEQVLAGQVWNDTLVEQAAAAVLADIAPRGDFRGSVEYRREMAEVLTRRTLKELSA